MTSLIRATSVAAAAILIAGLAASTVATTASADTATPTGTPIGLSRVTDVSKSGRLALGFIGSRAVVRDITKNKTIRKLSTKRGYPDLSDTGRYVLYQTYGNASIGDIGVIDVKTGKARSAVTTKSGAKIKPAWQAHFCGEDCYDSDKPTVRGALSGNGRYVTYCANFTQPTRGDLYIKDMRTKAVKTFPGACPMTGEDTRPEKQDLPYTIDISETGRVIFVMAGYETNQVRLVLNRSTIRELQLPGPPVQMPNDGSALYYGEATPYTPGDTTYVYDPIGKRYDISTGAIANLPPGDPAGLGTPGDYRTPDSMTRRGRFVSYSGSIGPNSAIGLAQIGVFDRLTGTTRDLTPVLDTLGLPREGTIAADGSRYTPEYTTLISGDGKVLLFGGTSNWYKVKLTS